MRIIFVAILGLVLTGLSPGQTGSPAHESATSPRAGEGPTGAQGNFGSSAIWQPSPEFVTAAQAACEKGEKRNGKCEIEQMEKAGAPGDAVKFARELYAKTRDIGMIGEIKSFGPVSLAWIVYPFRTTDRDGLMLLNGKPNFVNPDDLKLLDKDAMQRDPVFQEWKKTMPKLDDSQPDRGGGSAQIQYARTFEGPTPGSQRFLFSYPLTDGGCRHCKQQGFANYYWDFDPKGNFQGAHFISVTRGMPPKRPARTRMTAPPAAVAPPSATQPATSPTLPSTPPSTQPAPAKPQ